MAFSGKVVLITGASSGIGAGSAEYFAGQGALLALNGRNAERLQEVCDKVKDIGVAGEPLLIVADVSTEAERIISETIERFGQLDVLINNAGIGRFLPFQQCPVEEFDVMMATNARAVYQLSQLAAPHLIETKGNIVNVSSIAAVKTFGGLCAYSMTKAALDQLTRYSAIELAEKGVRVNSINPATIETGFFHASGVDHPEAIIGFMSKNHPVGRNGTVKDCVNAIAFMANEENSFITGVCMLVDGGMYSKLPF